MGGRRIHPFSPTKAINVNVKRALSSYSRVQLAKRARGCIPGIGEQRLAIFSSCLIEPLETLLREEYFTPNLKASRGLLGNGEGNRPHRSQILSYILSSITIAPRCAGNEHALRVGQGYRQAVHLDFTDQIEGLAI